MIAQATSIDDLFRQGNAAQDAGNYAAAEAIWRQVLRLDANNAGAYNNLGNALSAQGNLEEALASGAIASALGYVVWYQVLPQLTSTEAAAVQLMAAVGAVLALQEPITVRLGVTATLSSVAPPWPCDPIRNGLPLAKAQVFVGILLFSCSAKAEWLSVANDPSYDL